jgi:hypothetical protein
VPITQGIGTRFPIEITLIEDPNKFQIKPSIVLDPKAQKLSSMEMEKIQKFNLGQVYNDPMTQVEFETLLREVSFVSFNQVFSSLNKCKRRQIFSAFRRQYLLEIRYPTSSLWRKDHSKSQVTFFRLR